MCKNLEIYLHPMKGILIDTTFSYKSGINKVKIG